MGSEAGTEEVGKEETVAHGEVDRATQAGGGHRHMPLSSEKENVRKRGDGQAASWVLLTQRTRMDQVEKETRQTHTYTQWLAWGHRRLVYKIRSE